MSKPKTEKTPEQIAAQKLKRQQYYKNIDPKKKEAIIAKQLERNKNRTAEQIATYQAKQRIPKELQGGKSNTVLQDYILHDDIKGDINVNSSWTPTLARLDKKVQAHKKAWAAKCDRIKAWEASGGLYPPPNIQDKMEVTELFAKVMHVKGRRCIQCGTHDMWDFNWRITRKADVWAYVPFQKSAYEEILRNPDAFDVYCLPCAWDMDLPIFYWIFGIKSPRNSDKPMHDMFGPRYANWNEKVQIMYPRGWHELTDKIKRGEIKSLSCQLIYSNGKKGDSILRKKEFHTYVKNTPRDFHCCVMEEVGQFYQDNFPKGFWRGVGWNPPENNLSHSRERNPKFMTDELKAWILKTPMGPHIQWGGKWNIEPPPLPVPEKDLERKGHYC